MFTIHLNKLAFFAHHGLQSEEAVAGTNFEIDVSIKIDDTEKITSIRQTINYVDVYAIVSRHMKSPLPLLETVAQNICADIVLLDPRAHEITVRVNKLHPPISNFAGNVGVTYSKVY